MMTSSSRQLRNNFYLPPPKSKHRKILDAEEIINTCQKKKEYEDTIQTTEEKKRNTGGTKQGTRAKLKPNESLLSDEGNSDKKEKKLDLLDGEISAKEIKLAKILMDKPAPHCSA